MFKSDVFAFGKVLLEVIAGCKEIDVNEFTTSNKYKMINDYCSKSSLLINKSTKLLILLMIQP